MPVARIKFELSSLKSGLLELVMSLAGALAKTADRVLVTGQNQNRFVLGDFFNLDRVLAFW